MSPLLKTVVLASLAALIAAGVRFGVTFARANETERALADLSALLDERAPLVTAVEEFKQGRETAEVKAAIIRELRDQPSIPWTLIHPLLAPPPPGVTVEEVSADASTLEVSGRAESLDPVARWLQELQSRDGLGGLDLAGFEVPRRGRKKGGRFTLAGRLPAQVERPEHSEPGP
jgi:Tfp pilus assembly protein PilN